MNWLRSRRFYAGLGIGILPLLLLAFTQSGGEVRSDERSEGHPVVVRTYAGCCPDSTDAERTRALIESLPKDVVLVETWAGCCCGDSTRVYGPTSGRNIDVPPFPITGTGPGRAAPPAAPIIETPIADVPALAVVPPIEGGAPGGLPPVDYVLPPAPVEAGLPGWLGFLVAPLVVVASELDGDFGDGIVEGILCPDDSGVPTGPNRPRC